jgi:prophage antirepressor-like protein
MNLITPTLAFKGTEFNTIDRFGELWLRSPQVGDALGYTKGRISVDKIFKAHADEFSDRMTAVVELMTAGGKQMVRIFSLRGAHLLAMFARTPVAKAFRRWVLDILDQEVVRARPAQAPTDQQAFFALKQAVAQLVGRGRSTSYPRIYGLLRARFGVGKVEQLAAEQLSQAVAFVHGLATQWELLEPQALAASAPALSAATRENIERLCADAEFTRSWWASFGPAIELINPEVASLIREHIIGAAACARHLVRDLALPSTQKYAAAYPWRGERAARQAYAVANSSGVTP